MFKKNKYSTTYFRIIERAQNRTILGYNERHHIIPRCMGGQDDSSNIVPLTAREHFICHLLLIRMVEDEYKHKMVYAAWQQSRPRSYTELKVTNRIYNTLREQLSESYKGRKRAPFSETAKANMRAGASNRKKVLMTESRLQNIRLGVAKRERLTGEKNPFYGKTHSLETIDKIINVNKTTHTCPHCGKVGSSNSMKRWHFDKCKIISLTYTDDSNDRH